MKKLSAFTLLIVIIMCSVSFHPVYAADDKSYYGDGISAKWDDIVPYLSVLYRNTPYISISNGKETRTFQFNTELFWDLGLYVYGEPDSVQFSGTVNDFKAAANGYFRAGSNENIAGEYRFLGFSIGGVPITNSRFPTEIQSDGSDIFLVKYTELPANLKKAYGVNSFSNAAYMPIRDLIENPNSPVWNFTTKINNKDVSLKEKLTQIGLFKNNAPTIALLDYGVVYSWAESGGIIRLFFRSGKNKDKYAYSTFMGPVNIDFITKMPKAVSEMKIEGGLEHKIGENTFYMKASDKKLSFDVALHGVMEDYWSSLSDFAKMYSYTRDNMTGYSICIDGKTCQKVNLIRQNSTVIFNSVLRGYTVDSSMLVPGRNTLTIDGVLRVDFSGNGGNRYISAPCSINVTVIYDISTPTVAVPTEIPQKTPLPTAKPSCTPRIDVERKW